MGSLEDKLEDMFVYLGIKEEYQNNIKAYLNLLKVKDEATYHHSIRVGLLATKIAEFMHLDRKALFYSGLLHDVGKAVVDLESLTKTEGFDEKDMEELKNHVMYGYKMVSGIHEFSAEILVRHHRFQKDGYPKDLPKCKIDFSDNTKLMIDYMARMLSLADFYDAVSTRKNEKFGEKRTLSSDEVKNIMLEHNADQKYLIEELYDNKIFV